MKIVVYDPEDQALNVRCPACSRPLDPWPLKRGARCSSPEWAYCIRNDDESIIEAMQEALRKLDDDPQT